MIKSTLQIGQPIAGLYFVYNFKNGKEEKTAKPISGNIISYNDHDDQACILEIETGHCMFIDAKHLYLTSDKRDKVLKEINKNLKVKTNYETLDLQKEDNQLIN